MKLTTNPERLLACTTEIIALLQKFHEAIENNTIDKVLPNPFATQIEPSVVSEIIDNIAREFQYEITNSPGYHRTNQGIDDFNIALIPPRFSDMDYPQQLAFVQQLSDIYHNYPYTEEDGLRDNALVLKQMSVIEDMRLHPERYNDD